MIRLGLLGLGACVTVAMLGSTATAAAQSEFLGESCGATLTRCRTTGLPCGDTSHPVTLISPMGEAICVCASGVDSSLGAPALCCSSTGGCPGGSTCTNIDGASVDLCTNPSIDLCTTDVSLDMVLACFTPPGATTSTPYWTQGDCDGDGRANGIEASGPADPCCNEDTDFDCCMAELADPVACCARTASDPNACCLSAGVEPGLCCASDPLGCCGGSSDPESCCRAAGGDAASCCAFSSAPGACCLAHGGDPNLCCELAVDETLPQCSDAGVSDAGVSDAGVSDAGTGDAGDLADGGSSTTDAATAADGGAANGDAGASGMDGGNLGFGGGGGCRCNAQGRSTPTPWTLVIAVLAIAIPAYRKRR